MKTRFLDYHEDKTVLEGYLAYEESPQLKPAVIICHAWMGQDDFTRHKTEMIAELGYVGFAVDIYGKGKRASNREEAAAFSQPFFQDRQFLHQRLMAAYETVNQLKIVDTQRIAIMGYCFGGMCALDLARSNNNIKGAISFHGVLAAPPHSTHSTISAKVLALHGMDDPMVPPTEILKFSDEMTKAKADWQFHIFGNTMHAFTNPEANDPDFGTVYQADADRRSWDMMKLFLEEVFK